MMLAMLPEFEISGHLYRFEGMPAQSETRILRRLAPILSEAVAVVLAPGLQVALRQDLDVVAVARAAFAAWGDPDCLSQSSVVSNQPALEALDVPSGAYRNEAPRSTSISHRANPQFLAR